MPKQHAKKPHDDSETDLKERRNPSILHLLGPWLRRYPYVTEYLREAAALSLLGALILAFFWRLITPDSSARQYIVPGDFTNQFYPFHFYTVKELSSGHLPLWNPYIFSGHPFLADIQTAVLYPLTIITALIARQNGLSFLILEWRVIAAYALACLFTYGLARELLKDRRSALLVAITFTFSGFLTSYPALQLPILDTVIWLPLILLFLQRGINKGNFLYLTAAGIVFCISILGGHPQTAMLITYTSLLYILYSGWVGGWTWGRRFLGIALFLFIGFGLAAVQLIPSLELLTHSVRDKLPYEVASWGYDWQSLVGILLPTWRGEKALYIGILPLLLALLIPRPSKQHLFWIGLFLFSILLSLGDKGFLYRLLYPLIPGFAMFQDQERAIFLYSLTGSILAGFGFQSIGSSRTLSNESASYTRRLILVSLGLLLLAYLPVILQNWGSIGSFGLNALLPILSNYKSLALLLLLAFPLLYLRLQGKVNAPLFSAAIVALVVLDLFSANWSNNFGPTQPVPGAAIKSTTAFLEHQSGLFRLRGQDEHVLPPNYGMFTGLANISGDTPFQIKRMQQLLYSPHEWRLWQLLNVKYILTRAKLDQGVKLVFEEGDIKTYEMLFALPRAYVVQQVRVADSPEQALAMVLSEGFNPGTGAVLEEKPKLAAAPAQQQPATVIITEYTPKRMKIATKTSDDGILVVSETYYPGWKAYLDGQPAKIYRADYVLRAIELPHGSHELLFVYDPDSFKMGLIISSITSFFLLLLSLITTLGQPRRTP
ncbi:MAG: YfhO family protein [Chloroflexi bacterium]|nr:YfhO family protein [Chloroflexota bacterium]MCL5075046.1 YfhO family protein [Chloroflexota bacterium]